MTLALDLGSSEFRILRRDGQRLIAQRTPAFYTLVENHTEQREFLETSRIPYSVTGDALVVIGQRAFDVAKLMSRPVIPVLKSRTVPGNDPIGRQVCAWLIDSLVPLADSPQATCVMAEPITTLDARNESAKPSNNRFLEYLVKLRGYRAVSVHPATALAFAELESDEFSGACLSLGAEFTTFSITHHSVPLLETSFQMGVGEILERFADHWKRFLWDHTGNLYRDTASVQKWLHEDDICLQQPSSSEEAWLADALMEMLLSTFFKLKRKLTQKGDARLQKPIPLVISGGITLMNGYLDLVAEAIKLSGVPLNLTELRPASFEPYSVARGLLIHASLGAEAVSSNSAA